MDKLNHGLLGFHHFHFVEETDYGPHLHPLNGELFEEVLKLEIIRETEDLFQDWNATKTKSDHKFT